MQPGLAADSPVRGRILTAAQRRFAAFGFRRTGVAEIARDAGVAPGTLYRYFKDKEDIFREVVRELNERWVERARRVVGEPGPAIERLARLGQASVEFNRENSLVRSVFRRDEEIVFAPLVDELHDQLVRATVALMAEVIRDGIREGTIRPMNAEHAAFVLFIGGEALNTPHNWRYHPYEDVLPVYIDITAQGLLSR